MLKSYSASQIATAENCPRQHYYRDILKVRPTATAANLAFGKCIDESVREYLRALALGEPLPDAIAMFQALWRSAREREDLVYASTQDAEQFARMGHDLMQQLPTAWERTGFRVALDAAGVPLLDRALSVIVRRDNRALMIKGILDLAVYTPESKLAVVDVKSSAMPHTQYFTLRADQLTTYQLLLDTHAPGLGLPRLGALGFWDLVKRKASSYFEDPVMVPIRSPEAIDELIEKIFWRAEDDARERFPRTPRMQFNSPCEECDFARYCIEDDPKGLVFPEGIRVAFGVLGASAPK